MSNLLQSKKLQKISGFAQTIQRQGGAINKLTVAVTRGGRSVKREEAAYNDNKVADKEEPW